MQAQIAKPYTHGAISPSDPCERALGFASEAEAALHAENMNRLRELWPAPPWNQSYWPERPRPWLVVPMA